MTRLSEREIARYGRGGDGVGLGLPPAGAGGGVASGRKYGGGGGGRGATALTTGGGGGGGAVAAAAAAGPASSGKPTPVPTLPAPPPPPPPPPSPNPPPPCASCGQRQRRSLEDLAPDPPAERLEVPGQRSPSDVGRAAPERGQHITALGADVAGRLEPGRPRPRPRQLPRAVGGPRGGPHSTAPILAARRELDHLTTLGAGSGSNAATRARCRPEELLSPNNSAIRAMTQ